MAKSLFVFVLTLSVFCSQIYAGHPGGGHSSGHPGGHPGHVLGHMPSHNPGHTPGHIPNYPGQHNFNHIGAHPNIKHGRIPGKIYHRYRFHNFRYTQRMWSPIYRCWCYYCPQDLMWYYWYLPLNYMYPLDLYDEYPPTAQDYEAVDN